MDFTYWPALTSYQLYINLGTSVCCIDFTLPDFTLSAENVLMFSMPKLKLFVVSDNKTVPVTFSRPSSHVYDSHYKVNTVVRPSHFYNVNSYILVRYIYIETAPFVARLALGQLISIERPPPSWLLQMPWCQISTRSSTTTMLTPICNYNRVTVNKQTMLRGSGGRQFVRYFVIGGFVFSRR